MQQLKSAFGESGTRLVSDLTFFNPLSSPDLIEQEAKMIADQLDNILRNARGANYEQGIDRSTAMSQLVQQLVNGQQQLSQLAEVVDNIYLFWGE